MGDGKVEYTDVTVKCTKETFEIYQALTKIVQQVKVSGKDGFQAVTDIPAVILGSINELSVAVAGLGEIGEEIQMSLPEFVQANSTGAGMVAGVLLEKPAPTTPPAA